MKHVFAFSAAALATLLMTGAAMARDPAGTSSSGTSQDATSQGSGSKNGTSQSTSPSERSTTPSERGTTSAAPAEKPGVLSMPHRVTGSVASVDKKANRVNVVDSKGKELSLVADADTASELSRLKAGDHVKINYKKNKDDQLVATKIELTANGTGRTSKTK